MKWKQDFTGKRQKANGKRKTESGVFIITACLYIFVLTSCNSHYTIKQKGYFKIDLPAHEYKLFDRAGYPYSFEYPVYADVTKDTTYFEDVPENPYWININFPSLNGKIYISYKDLRINNFEKMVDDAFKLTYKHSTKATAIRDSVMHTGNGVSGIFSALEEMQRPQNNFLLPIPPAIS